MINYKMMFGICHGKLLFTPLLQSMKHSLKTNTQSVSKATNDMQNTCTNQLFWRTRNTYTRKKNKNDSVVH